jgi:DNA/RNA endonuclease G (NUC1)
MNPGRRLAHYTAYNCDASQLVEVPRRRDNWLADPLVPESLQMNLPLLSQSPYDRGHLMARLTGKKLCGTHGTPSRAWSDDPEPKASPSSKLNQVLLGSHATGTIFN